MKISSKGQITIPPGMRKKHGLLPQCQIQLIDQPNGVLVVKIDKASPGKRAVAALLRGGKVKARTSEWLRVTRGDA